jgi:FtsH-binding integral membrane protein
MDQTIRNYVKRRVWWCAACGFAGWLMFALGASLAKTLPDGAPRAAIPVLGFVLFGGAILALQRIVRCPKCKSKLGQTIAMPLAFSWGSGPKINFCPYCGVNVDEPVPRAQSPVESLNPIK